LDTPSYR